MHLPFGRFLLSVSPEHVACTSVECDGGFEAAMLLGLLAFRLSRDRRIAIIVGLTALITPGFSKSAGYSLTRHSIPGAGDVLLSLHSASIKDRWTWGNIASVALTLTLLTYTYTIGRLLAPLLALGLIFFVTNKGRLVDVKRVGSLWPHADSAVGLQPDPSGGLTSRFRYSRMYKRNSRLRKRCSDS